MDRLKNASDEERERIQAEYKQKVEDIVAKTCIVQKYFVYL